MSHSPAKTSETRFVHPWHTTARYRRHIRRRARAEQHSGAHATLLEKTGQRRNTAPTCRGISASAEIRRRLSGEKQYDSKKGACPAFPSGWIGRHRRDTSRLKNELVPPTHLPRYRFQRSSIRHNNVIENLPKFSQGPLLRILASFLLCIIALRWKLNMSGCTPCRINRRDTRDEHESFPPPDPVGNNMRPSPLR